MCTRNTPFIQIPCQDSTWRSNNRLSKKVRTFDKNGTNLGAPVKSGKRCTCTMCFCSACCKHHSLEMQCTSISSEHHVPAQRQKKVSRNLGFPWGVLRRRILVCRALFQGPSFMHTRMPIRITTTVTALPAVAITDYCCSCATDCKSGQWQWQQECHYNNISCSSTCSSSG